MAELAVALDFSSPRKALEIVESLGEGAKWYKVGLELYAREGPAVVEALRSRGKEVFLDLKLHDIPNTVAGAVEGARETGAGLLTLHAAGGVAMIRAAREAAGSDLRLLAVTVLTSLEAEGLGQVWGRPAVRIEEEVLRLARLAVDGGADGVVASAREAVALKADLGRDLFVATPGIRLPGGDAHDQARVTTPAEAVAAGSDLLVVGRAITGAREPREALERIRAHLLEPAGAGGEGER